MNIAPKRKPILGETLYSLNVGNAARRSEQKLTPVIVTKVGKKYFTAAESSRDRGTEYYIENWIEKTNTCIDSELFEREQEWLDRKESETICREIQANFGHYGMGTSRKPLTLETLRKIKRLMDGQEDFNEKEDGPES